MSQSIRSTYDITINDNCLINSWLLIDKKVFMTALIKLNHINTNSTIVTPLQMYRELGTYGKSTPGIETNGIWDAFSGRSIFVSSYNIVSSHSLLFFFDIRILNSIV